MPTIPEAIALAIQHHQAGRLAAAENIYRQILAQQPDQVQALQLLGVLSSQQGRHSQAVELIRKAIEQVPNSPVYYLNLGEAERRAGNRPAAIAAFRRVIEFEPNYFLAFHNLGSVLREEGRLVESLLAVERSIALQGDYPDAFCNLAATLLALGRIAEARIAVEQALRLRPKYPEAFNELGNVLNRENQPEEALAAYRQAVELFPAYAEAHYNLGNLLLSQQQRVEARQAFQAAIAAKSDFAAAHWQLGNIWNQEGNAESAIAAYRTAIGYYPEYVDAIYQLAKTLREQGEFDEALTLFQRVVSLRPEDPLGYNSLGAAYLERRRFAEAAEAFQQALALKPDFSLALSNLCMAWYGQGKLNDAIQTAQRAIELEPDLASAHNNLANFYKDQGNLPAAISSLRRVLELSPGDAGAHSNLLFMMSYCPEVTAAELAAEHREYERRHAAPLRAQWPVHKNDLTPDRRLRVGYVSPDLHNHPVARYMLPLLENHNHEAFEIYAYASVAAPDSFTERCRRECDVWRDVMRWPDERVARLVLEDEIDILVDLSMHTGLNRLLMFARKPAPVQVCYLGTVGTTGLTAIDYRLTDPFLDPPHVDARVYSEQSYVLPETTAVYRPSVETPSVSPSPAIDKGYITFGCFNNFAKVSNAALALWGELLNVVPNSRLLMIIPSGESRERTLQFFISRGIESERLVFLDRVLIRDYFRIFERVDIALDPFPYNGGTTSFDTLWMGVPLVTLAGKTAVGRAGVSILGNLGLSELIGRDEAEYIRIAAELARDLPRLTQLRSTIRPRMQASPLMDAPRFARNVEAAYRAMWQKYCAQARK